MEPRTRPLYFGERLDLLTIRTNKFGRLNFGAVGGRYTLLYILRDAEKGSEPLEGLARLSAELRMETHLAMVICADPNGEAHPAVQAFAQAGVVVWDEQRETVATWGVDVPPHDPSEPGCWVLIDPGLRVLGIWRYADHVAATSALLRRRDPSNHAGVPLHAPVLIAPRIFEPAFCKQLIDYYQKVGGEPSGMTRENEEGKTYVALDDAFKRRSDCFIEDVSLQRACMHRVYWRLIPEIEKAFMFKATRMERYIVSCYDSSNTGFFRPHRDNTTKGTAHRRFAVTINLNVGEYEGGDLRFPEFGAKTYRAPTGGAVVFSCALLHEATPVTSGRRFAFLPFLYDEAGAALRRENNVFLDESIGAYDG